MMPSHITGALKLERSFRVVTSWVEVARPLCPLHWPVIGYPLPRGKGITLGKAAPSGEGNSQRGEFWRLKASSGVSSSILKRDLGNTAQQQPQGFLKELFPKVCAGCTKNPVENYQITSFIQRNMRCCSSQLRDWIDNGQTIYKNRTLIHNLQQPAQKTTHYLQ